MRRLTDEEIKERLQRLDGWSHIENRIEKKYVFEGFRWSLQFLTIRGSSAARDMKHYPEYLIHDNEVTIRCWTREAGGLTELERFSFEITEKQNSLRGGQRPPRRV